MNRLIAMLSMSSLVASPAMASVRAAAYASTADRHSAQTSLFAGATYRIGFDRRDSRQRGRAAINIAGMSRTPTAEFRVGQGLELTGGKGGKPTLSLAGQDLGQFKQRAQLKGTTTALIIGGVVLVGVVAAVLISDYQRSQRCIGEEGDCD